MHLDMLQLLHLAGLQVLPLVELVKERGEFSVVVIGVGLILTDPKGQVALNGSRIQLIERLGAAELMCSS